MIYSHSHSNTHSDRQHLDFDTMQGSSSTRTKMVLDEGVNLVKQMIWEANNEATLTLYLDLTCLRGRIEGK